jgi:hypothetical protein
MLAVDLLPLVHSKLPVGNPLCSREKLPGNHGAMLWLLSATAIIELDAADEMPWLACWLNSTHKRSRAAVAGGNQLKRKEGSDSALGVGRRASLRLSLAEGRRGTQERNCISSSFKSFIFFSFQRSSQFLQSIPVSSGGRIGRDGHQGANLLEGVLVPNL